jgi:bacterioferritin
LASALIGVPPVKHIYHRSAPTANDGDLTPPDFFVNALTDRRGPMKGDVQVLKLLNEVLKKELTGINQYFLHAKMCKNWGYEVLYENIWKESIGEMKHADEVTERILFLDGVPNMAGYDKILIGSSVKQQLENDLGLEYAALDILRPGIKTCIEVSDNVTRELLEHIMVDEEEHIDWIEAQLHKIEEVGYQNYLAQQIYKKG